MACSFHQAAECFEERLSASAPSVKGGYQEPKNEGRNQNAVCPADNNAVRGRRTTEDDGSVEQRQAQPRQSSYPNQRSRGRRPGLIARETIAHQREYHGRTEDDDQSSDAVQQAAKGPFWIRRENARTEIGEADDKQPPGPQASKFCMDLLPCCYEESERSRSKTEESERHQPAKATQLVFANEMRWVELWLQHMKGDENGHARDA